MVIYVPHNGSEMYILVVLFFYGYQIVLYYSAEKNTYTLNKKYTSVGKGI